MAVLPEEVGFAEAAALPMAGLTALRALRLGGGDLLARRVLVTGASGGVGRFAVQLAALSGASVSGVVGSPERGQGLAEMGASEVAKSVGDAEGSFDLILESVGGRSLEAAIAKLAPGGTLVVFGKSSGEKAAFDLYDFVGLWPQGARIEVFFSASGARPVGEDLGLLSPLLATGKLVSQVGWEGSWYDIAVGIDALRERRVAGKAVFHLD